jgi:hypothetical protein
MNYATVRQKNFEPLKTQNHAQKTIHLQSTFIPPTNYAYDTRSAQKQKSVRNSRVIHAFLLCDWHFRKDLILITLSTRA